MRDERESFDEYFKKTYPELYKDVFDPDGDERAIIGYSFAMKAWQARAKADAVPDKLKEIKGWANWHIEDYQISEPNEHDRGWYNACCDLINIIESGEKK